MPEERHPNFTDGGFFQLPVKPIGAGPQDPVKVTSQKVCYNIRPNHAGFLPVSSSEDKTLKP